MATISQDEKAAILLLKSIQAEWEHDLRFGGWLGAEGERVRDNALALVEALRSGTLSTELAGASVHDYLGQGWLEVHAKSYELADALQSLVTSGAA